MNKETSQIKFGFLGTDKFSVTVLNELKIAGLIPESIITLPNRIKGRGLESIPTDAKLWAIENNISIIEVSDFSDEILNLISNKNYDLCALASFGLIIPQKVLDICGAGILNVHPSLLPKHRGASPIEFAILNDEKETGTTIMLMDSKMDHGPILMQEKKYFDEWIDKMTVEEDLAKLGGKMLAECILNFKDLKPIEQNHDEATFTKKFEKADGQIDLTDDARKNYLKIIAMNPWPGTYFFYNFKGRDIRIKITKASWQNNDLVIEKVIPEGRHEMTFSDFCRGFNFSLPKN